MCEQCFLLFFSLGRRRSKTQESQSTDCRNSGDSDSGGRPRGVTSAASSAGGISSDQPARGRSGTALSLNEDDSADVDSVCTVMPCSICRIPLYTVDGKFKSFWVSLSDGSTNVSFNEHNGGAGYG